MSSQIPMFASRAPSEGGTYFKMAGKYINETSVTVEVPDLTYVDLLTILVSATCSYAFTKYDAIFFFIYYRHHHAADCPTNHYDTGDLFLPVAME